MAEKNESGFLANLVDRTGRPVFLPKTVKELPKGVFEVTSEVFTKILKGEPRVYNNDKGQILVQRGGNAWLPGANPGKGWAEVTDPEHIKQILAGDNSCCDGTEGSGGEKKVKLAAVETPKDQGRKNGKHAKVAAPKAEEGGED